MGWTMKVVTEKEQNRAKWSGGITTQLAIYPPEADYQKRNFAWRISTASVDDEKSTFTSLPGFKRIIMPLQGEPLKLNHKEHHKVTLNPLETDTFQGAWTTESEGRVQDFNLMLAAGCDGNMQGYDIIDKCSFKPQINTLESKGNTVTVAFYLLTGQLTIEQGKQTSKIQKGDFVTFTAGAKEKPGEYVLRSKGEVPAILACVVVKYDK
ncbi:MAG: HutD family protein [Acidaminococcaceae bacterium]|jgi:environmental stress-induced protein Ves|nr:HutD family protein [Acidaminococcaceae bacterium]